MTAVGPSLEQLQLLLTERCNLTCSHCAVPEESSPAEFELDTVQWERFMSAVLAAGVRRLVLSGGEALLRTDCLHLAAHALDRGAERVVIVTNGTTLPVTTSQRLAALQQRHPGLLLHVSIDGVDAPSHDLIRGTGAFERTMVGLRRLRMAGGRIDGVHTVLNRRNVLDLDDLAELCRALGATTWTVFPVASLGRGFDLDHLRLDQSAWAAILQRLADHPPAGLDLGIMGPTIGDEWGDLRSVPAPRSVLSPQAVVGPDGAAFTCPPLRSVVAGEVLDVIDGASWLDVDMALRSTMAEACPTCKYRSLCTGVDPSAPLLRSAEPFGEPSIPVKVDAPRPAASGRAAR